MNRFAAASVVMAFFAVPIIAQQDYVGRFDAYAGFAYLDSPHIHLQERGYHLQSGLRVRRWATMGFDFSHTDGNATLGPNLLLVSLQQLRDAWAASGAAEG